MCCRTAKCIHYFADQRYNSQVLNSCVFMEELSRLLKMLIVLFFSTDRLPLLLPACVGSRLNFETEERGTTEVVENRSQLRIFQEREAVRRLSGGLNGFGE